MVSGAEGVTTPGTIARAGRRWPVLAAFPRTTVSQLTIRWVNAAEPVFKVVNPCVFADLSSIDEFGILTRARARFVG
jgi:hypothetical protein